MADIAVTAASVLASSVAVTSKQYNFGATVTAGQLVYLNSSNLWVLADSDASATGNGVTDVRGFALNGGANGQPATVVLEDVTYTPGGTLANGVPYFSGSNAGGFTATIPTTGNYPVFLGIAKSTTTMNLKPVAGGTIV